MIIYCLDSDTQGGLTGWRVTYDPTYREEPVRVPNVLAVPEPDARIYWNGRKV